jgi:hypothetical protein
MAPCASTTITSFWERNGGATDHNPEQKLITTATPLSLFLYQQEESDLYSTSSSPPRSIPIQGDHQKKAEEDLDDEAIARAEYCDLCVFSRIVDGIITQVDRQRIQHPEFARQNIQTLNSIVRTRTVPSHPFQKYYADGQDDHELKNNMTSATTRKNERRRWWGPPREKQDDDHSLDSSSILIDEHRKVNRRARGILLEQHDWETFNNDEGELSLFFPLDL